MAIRCPRWERVDYLIRDALHIRDERHTPRAQATMPPPAGNTSGVHIARYDVVCRTLSTWSPRRDDASIRWRRPQRTLRCIMRWQWRVTLCLLCWLHESHTTHVIVIRSHATPPTSIHCLHLFISLYFLLLLCIFISLWQASHLSSSPRRHRWRDYFQRFSDIIFERHFFRYFPFFNAFTYQWS